MSGGGRFRVLARDRTIAAEPTVAQGLAGDFVALHFTDSGCGMPPEVLAQAFDPYFTTKAIGAGSRLGLSQVYGLAKQSGGGATIVSELGAGTTVTLFLPRAPGDGAPPVAAVGPAARASGG